MDRAALVNLTFCRLLLKRVFAEVKAVCPQARARDAAAIKIPPRDWYFELPDRPWYGGRFSWSGRADNAFHAKVQGWEEWLKRRVKKEEGA